MVTVQEHPMAGKVHVLSPPYRFDGQRCPVRLRPPLLGEHTEEVLSGLLGKTRDQINELLDEGVIRKF
jgi:crotonobetainyl-CoA:carnitine CoA-transferase CaiB-like acyl-CoA transferase